jgi:glycosyltransferase involved in cell wall biosynthesis
MSPPEILFISSYPPRVCGIATYTEDLIRSLKKKFGDSFLIRIYPLPADTQPEFDTIRKKINQNDTVRMVVVQHEFGLFSAHEPEFVEFLSSLTKPVIIVFHTVLPYPSLERLSHVQTLTKLAAGLIVMTRSSANILQHVYGVDEDLITVIPHGTHLVTPIDIPKAKREHGFEGRRILSTFGLLGSGKSIETTLDALPAIIAKHPNVIFLAIGKTHPGIIKHEGEAYRDMLEAKVATLGLQDHVRFINEFLPLNDLLTYLQMTDIYLFTSKDPNQSVSGTFAYALSCGCPIVSTPIPHAKEVLSEQTGITFDFGDSAQLANAVNRLLTDEVLGYHFGQNGLHAMAPTAWENSAIAHARLFERHCDDIRLDYAIPKPNLAHIHHLTTGFGMIQFSKINDPDLATGYTLDDNARALIALVRHYEATLDETDLAYIRIYMEFIQYCQQPDGGFLNYVDAAHRFTSQNDDVNLDDSNGRAIWALGVVVSMETILPKSVVRSADEMMDAYLMNMTDIHSTRAMAFMIKGLYYRNLTRPRRKNDVFITKLADRLVQMYRHEAEVTWKWFERYLTYGNSVIPEALLMAWMVVRNPVYLTIARTSFDYLMEKTFDGDSMRLISNVGWMRNGDNTHDLPIGGEQPIEVAYAVSALTTFHAVFPEEGYDRLKTNAFSWFLGNNRMHQIVYNPRTGGCYDGLEDGYLNLNQGAESTVSYLIARMAMEKRTLPCPLPEAREGNVYA